jgi:hypothetical protein
VDHVKDALIIAKIVSASFNVLNVRLVLKFSLQSLMALVIQVVNLYVVMEGKWIYNNVMMEI